MKVFKFGGTSMKEAFYVKRVASIIKGDLTNDGAVIVISAIGKATNALENILSSCFSKDTYKNKIGGLYYHHLEIIKNLFEGKEGPIFSFSQLKFQELKDYLSENKAKDFNFLYNQVVYCEELISSNILSHYLKHQNIQNQILDAGDYIKTDSNKRYAQVNWTKTMAQINRIKNKNTLYITQDFIGSDNKNTTTLGREDLAYSTAIFAYALKAGGVTIWKDVPGVLNANPRYFEQTQKPPYISHKEVIELAFYGASVIHPKKIQPVQNKEIKLWLHSFIDPMQDGVCIYGHQAMIGQVPCYALKKNQISLWIFSKNFSFIIEKSLGYIFDYLNRHQIKVNLQNTAISLKLCLGNAFDHFKAFTKEIKSTYKISFIKEVLLYTLYNVDLKKAKSLINLKSILFKQNSDNILQMLINETRI